MAAGAAQRPGRKTASTCTPQTDRCTHTFEIAGYSLLEGFKAGEFIQSTVFAVGGHDWRIQYFPNGETEEEYSNGYTSVFLDHMSETNKVMALCVFRLVNHATGLSKLVFIMDATDFHDHDSSWGTRNFKKRSKLKGPPYVQDDRLVIECDVTVIMGMPVSEKSEGMCEIQVPPSDLSVTFGKLLDEAKDADVKFKVKGEVFHAHKVVLAIRSPVFQAEFYGSLGDNNKRCIRIRDMQPAVFKALLGFIYTDSLPAMDDLTCEENEDMVKHLLVAADRYAMERMNLLCQSMLCKRLNVQNVAATLALADQHNATKLKDACIAFINSWNRACLAITMEASEKSAKYCKN